MTPETKAGVGKIARWLVICTSAVAGFEGLYTQAYLDPVKVPTICFGHIEGVYLGQHKTKKECEDLLVSDLILYDYKAQKCVHVAIGDSRRAAIDSFAYNVGISAWCRSTFNKRLNAGDPLACDELRKWTRAGPFKRLPGLVKRREAERIMCNTVDEPIIESPPLVPELEIAAEPPPHRSWVQWIFDKLGWT